MTNIFMLLAFGSSGDCLYVTAQGQGKGKGGCLGVWLWGMALCWVQCVSVFVDSHVSLGVMVVALASLWTGSHLTLPSVPSRACLPSASLIALPCSALSWQEIGRWQEGRSQDISFPPSLRLTVSPSAVASPCDSKPTPQTGLWALRTHPPPLT